MSTSPHTGKFIEEARAILQEQLANEQFGVSELADRLHMSRSNLLRKLKKHTGQSASQFIREFRLQKGMELLQETDMTVSEISYAVGFGTTSYFIKCFKDTYGYPPGEARKQEEVVEEATATETADAGFLSKYRWVLGISMAVIIAVGIYFLLKNGDQESPKEVLPLEKSIAVLPFQNLSTDAANLYFVNGLMEASLNNLQKIEDLRVISRTSVEKYRNTDKSVAEIAKELGVSYLVEGSGQRVDDQVVLHIQLIDAAGDTPLWSEQYNYQVADVFALQNEVAKKIAKAVEARVTPAEWAQIDKRPTENMEAYDLYLKALPPFQQETKEGLEEAIPIFEKAVAIDPEFSLAYAKLAMAYFFLDIYQTENKNAEIINNYADKALLYDSKSGESLIAKALYYIYVHEYRLAIPHLEKALEYDPNSSAVIQILSDLYARIIPDTRRYLKYALKGEQLDIEAKDSVGKSFIYLHLSNAFIQNGFVDKASAYIEKSLAFNPNNAYAPYLKVFIQYAEDQDMTKTTEALIREWKKDTTRLDILQEVGKFYYFQKKYDSAYVYYQPFAEQRAQLDLNIYPQENLKIGLVYEQMGFPEKAQEFYAAYRDYCARDVSIYQPASLAMQYLQEGKPELAMEQLQLFATKDNYQYWILLFLEKDPLMERLKNHPEYEETLQQIKDRFWEGHKALKKSLEEKGLI